MTNLPDANLAHRPRLSDMKKIPSIEAALESTNLTETAPTNIWVERSPRISPPERFQGRAGYVPDFLGDFKVEMPTALGAAVRDIVPVAGDASGKLDYQNFSVVMSGSRKLALYTACNMDGKTSVSIPRESPDKWFLDGRIATELQAGEELYVSNILDRGHLVRREDPNWGTDAQVANDDTFHFTNCAPQVDRVNRQIWLGLENYILKNLRIWDERISVFTGPIFAHSDEEYRGVRIPKAFWKVLAFMDDAGNPSSTAYIVKQEEQLSGLEAAFGAYKTFQRSVLHVESITGLKFGQLSDFDGFSNEERATGIELSSQIRRESDVRV